MSTIQTASIGFNFTSTEQFTAGEAPAAGSVTIQQNGFNRTISLKSTDAVPCSLTAWLLVTLSSGSAVVDFTSLPKTGGGTVDATGKKLCGLLIGSATANNHSVELGPNASNGYALFGSTNKLVIPAATAGLPGMQFFFGGVLPAVSGSVKQILLGAGTGTEVFQLGLMFTG